MSKKILSHIGQPLRITYEFTNKRDLEVAHKFATSLKDDYIFGGEITHEQLLNPSSQEDRVVLLRETIALSNEEATQAKLIPQSLIEKLRLITPEEAQQQQLNLPFVGAFLPPDQLEIATKLSIHQISPGTKVTIPRRLQNVQTFSKALKDSSFSSTLNGWVAIDVPGADYAAQDLLSKGGNVVIKYGRGSLGQYQWTIYDVPSYKKAMIQIDEAMRKANTTWQESGLVFERRLAVHDQLIIGQLYFMEQLISWIGRMDHAPVINTNGEEEIIYTGSTKLFILGSLKDFINIRLPSEAIEDLAKAKQFEKTMENYIKGGAVTRIQYNLLRGVVETLNPEIISSKPIAGITEVTLREGGGTGTEIRVLQTLASDSNSSFKQPTNKDKRLFSKLNGIPVIMGSTYLEYYPTKESYENKQPLPEGSEITYEGEDPKYGFVRIYTQLSKAIPFLNGTKDLKKFLYPNITEELS